jgi:hypothetical protein
VRKKKRATWLGQGAGLGEQLEDEARAAALAEIGLRELPPPSYDDEHRELADPPGWVGL